MNRWKYLALTILGIVALLAAAACGGDDDEDDGGDDATDAPAATTEAADDDDDGGGGAETFDIVMTDNLFDPAELTVGAGSDVTFNITNDGAAIHNMRVLGEDGEANTDDDAVSDPDLVSAGDSATLEWTAPDAPGVYDFVCDFHLPDMSGTITVE
jgi:plastocyanin